MPPASARARRFPHGDMGPIAPPKVRNTGQIAQSPSRAYTAGGSQDGTLGGNEVSRRSSATLWLIARVQSARMPFAEHPMNAFPFVRGQTATQSLKTLDHTTRDPHTGQSTGSCETSHHCLPDRVSGTSKLQAG
jgi:hypothetical protein